MSGNQCCRGEINVSGAIRAGLGGQAGLGRVRGARETFIFPRRLRFLPLPWNPFSCADSKLSPAGCWARWLGNHPTCPLVALLASNRTVEIEMYSGNGVPGNVTRIMLFQNRLRESIVISAERPPHFRAPRMREGGRVARGGGEKRLFYWTGLIPTDSPGFHFQNRFGFLMFRLHASDGSGSHPNASSLSIWNVENRNLFAKWNLRNSCFSK